MLTRATVVIFVFSICLTEGSKSCPSVCTCTAGERELDCSGKELNAIPELPDSNITSLDVSFNNISVVVPPNSSDWGRELKFFYLNNNRIKDVSFDFQSLPELTHVHLGHNLVTVVDSHSFEKNSNLGRLILSGNELTLLEDTEFLIVPSLSWIELENCSISHLPVNVFKNMSKLVVIKLGYNKIEQLDRELFSHLKKLRYLHLEENQIQQIDADIFKPNHRLQWLYFRSNPLNHFNGSHFLHAPSLLSLDISFCNITKIPNKFFSNLHDLLSLKLNNNRLDSFNMTAIPRNLEVLDISGNSMTTIHMPKEMIRHLTSLKHFDLTNNKFACECRLFALWRGCAESRTGSGDESSCDEFCPNLKKATCEEQQTVGGETEVGGVHARVNTISKDTGGKPETSDSQEKNDVENVDDPHVVSGEEANNTIGKLKMNDGDEDEHVGKVWSIITYSCIGVFGGLCLIGAIVLVTDSVLGCRKSRNRKEVRSASSSLRNVRLELMDPVEDRQETTPLSLHRGFDYVTPATPAHRNPQPGQLRHT